MRELWRIFAATPHAAEIVTGFKKWWDRICLASVPYSSVRLHSMGHPESCAVCDIGWSRETGAEIKRLAERKRGVPAPWLFWQAFGIFPKSWSWKTGLFFSRDGTGVCNWSPPLYSWTLVCITNTTCIFEHLSFGTLTTWKHSWVWQPQYFCFLLCPIWVLQNSNSYLSFQSHCVDTL